MIWLDTMSVHIESGDYPTEKKEAPKPEKWDPGHATDLPAVFAMASRVIEQLTAKYPNQYLVPHKGSTKP